MRGGEYTQQQVYPPPQQPYVPPQAAYRPFHTYAEYASLRSYEAQALAVRRGDPVWQMAYARAAMQSDSGIGTNNEFSWYNGGDFVISTNVDGKFSFASGIAVIGKVTYTNLEGKNVRLSDGSIAATLNQDLLSGQGGLAFELGPRQRTAAGSGAGQRHHWRQGQPVFGWPQRLRLYQAGLAQSLSRHPRFGRLGRPDRQGGAGLQPASGLRRVGQPERQLYPLWRAGRRGCGAHRRLGRQPALETWMCGNGVMAGISYDGHAEYRIGFDTPRRRRAPRPMCRWGIRNIENHAVTATLSSSVLGGLWFSAYGGYINDRYSNDGLLAGIDLHYMPAPGVDLALGVRHSEVSWVQGQTGKQTTAGLNLTLGMGAPPQPSWFVQPIVSRAALRLT
jgi:hypothetical protein